MADSLLETERLRLRRFTPEDGAHLFALDNDPAVMRYINGGTPTPREGTRDQILPGFLRYNDANPGFGFWAAIEKATGDFVGWFVFRPTGGDPQEVALGYRFYKAAWGRGYATEGAAALIERGFGEWGVERVIAGTYEKNAASRRVMKTGDAPRALFSLRRGGGRGVGYVLHRFLGGVGRGRCGVCADTGGVGKAEREVCISHPPVSFNRRRCSFNDHPHHYACLQQCGLSHRETSAAD